MRKLKILWCIGLVLCTAMSAYGHSGFISSFFMSVDQGGGQSIFYQAGSLLYVSGEVTAGGGANGRDFFMTVDFDGWQASAKTIGFNVPAGLTRVKSLSNTYNVPTSNYDYMIETIVELNDDNFSEVDSETGTFYFSS